MVLLWANPSRYKGLLIIHQTMDMSKGCDEGRSGDLRIVWATARANTISLSSSWVRSYNLPEVCARIFLVMFVGDVYLTAISKCSYVRLIYLYSV